MPPQNRGRSSGNSKCPRCGNYFKDLYGHVLRIHKTTLANLKQQQQSQRRFSVIKNAVHPNKNLFLKKKLNGSTDFNRAKKESNDKIKRLCKEIEGFRKELEKVKNKLNELEQANNADSDLNSNSMRMELDQKDEYIDKLTKQVSELKLVNEEKNNSIKNLENEIKKLTGDIEVFRNNFKLIALLESWLGIVIVKDDVTDSDIVVQ
ncbi:8304_t:CDS:2 [Gigaspora rosea]|nr:8304_t:CDS:2 [Gigaspora rosea]